MPRRSRIDSPGSLHHIMCRGIEKRKVFDTDADREHFLERLGEILGKRLFTPRKLISLLRSLILIAISQSIPYPCNPNHYVY